MRYSNRAVSYSNIVVTVVWQTMWLQIKIVNKDILCVSLVIQILFSVEQEVSIFFGLYLKSGYALAVTETLEPLMI